MANITFLDKIAQLLVENYSDRLFDIVVILPNKRAKVFLLEALKKHNGSFNASIFCSKIVYTQSFLIQKSFYINGKFLSGDFNSDVN